MTPSPIAYLRGLARVLGDQVSPRLPTPYEQAGMLREPMHLQAVAIEFERAAARRVEENQAIRRLMRWAVSLSELPGALRAQCETLAQAMDTDLRVQALQSSNQALRDGLIALQVELEQLTPSRVPESAETGAGASVLTEQSSNGPQALLEAIWQELKVSTERRRLPSDRF